jgi:uncharacterized membrane protein
MGSQDEEKKKLSRRIRRQNLIIIALGISVIALYLIIAYIYRGQRFPLPTPFP